MKKHNIIYKITNLINDKFYIGQHSTDDLDDGYMGSGKYLKRAQEKCEVLNFKKELLFDFNNFEDMNKKEIKIVNEEFIKRKDTYNIILGGGLDGKKLKIDKNGMLVYMNQNTIPVKDCNGNMFRIHKDDVRYLSGELKPIYKDMIQCIDDNGNTYKIANDDPRYLNGELKGITIGKIVVIDKGGNTFNVDKNDKRYLSGELKGVTSGRRLVKDIDNKVFWVNDDNKLLLCGELVKATKKELNVYKNGLD